MLEIDGWVQENGSHVVLPLIAANAAFFAKAAVWLTVQASGDRCHRPLIKEYKNGCNKTELDQPCAQKKQIIARLISLKVTPHFYKLPQTYGAFKCHIFLKR